VSEEGPVPERPQPLRVGYHQQLDALGATVTRLFALVTEGVAAASQALMADDAEARAAVLAGEETVDELMVQLEADIERVLLLQAPVAGELRWVLVLVRIVPQLERSGDLAVHIANRAGTGLVEGLPPAARGILERMGETAVQLWRGAADGFAERDPDAGPRLEREDDVLDELHRQLTEQLVRGDLDPGVAAEAALVARFYERLGDHAVHIATRISDAVR